MTDKHDNVVLYGTHRYLKESRWLNAIFTSGQKNSKPRLTTEIQVELEPLYSRWRTVRLTHTHTHTPKLHQKLNCSQTRHWSLIAKGDRCHPEAWCGTGWVQVSRVSAQEVGNSRWGRSHSEAPATPSSHDWQCQNLVDFLKFHAITCPSSPCRVLRHVVLGFYINKPALKQPNNSEDQ